MLIARIRAIAVSLIGLAALLLLSDAHALDGCWVPHGSAYNIDEHSTCRRVTNNHASGKQIFVPTKSAAEWSSGGNAFINATPAGVTLSACSSGAPGWISIGNHPINVVYFKMVTLTNGHVLTCGGGVNGLNNTTTACHTFNPATNTWTAIAPSPQAKRRYGLTALNDGGALMCGGIINTTSSKTCHRYNKTANTWSATANFPATSHYAKLATLDNGNVLGCTGTQCYIYNISTNTWASTSVPSPQLSDGYDAGAAKLPGNKVLMCDEDNERCAIYNGNTGTWTSVAKHINPGDTFSLSPLTNGDAIMCGGDDSDDDPIPKCSIYNVAANTWTETTPAPFGVKAHGQALLGDGRTLLCTGYARPTANRYKCIALNSGAPTSCAP